MDDKDFRILVELFRDPLASYAHLGRAASVSTTSAERRLSALEEEQVLAGYLGLPAAELFGREAVIATATAVVSESIFPAKLVAEKDVAWVARKHDGTIVMCLYLPPGTDPASVGLRRENGWSVSRPPKGPDAKDTSLTETDGRIIDALIDHPRVELAELSRRTGLPVPTVKDRRDALVKKRVFTIRPALLMRQGPGTILFELKVQLRAKDGAEKVRRAVDRGLVIHESEQPPTLLFLTRAHTIPGIYDMQSRIASLPDVHEVSFTIYREAAVATDRLHAWLSDAMAASRPGAKKASAKRVP